MVDAGRLPREHAPRTAIIRGPDAAVTPYRFSALPASAEGAPRRRVADVHWTLTRWQAVTRWSLVGSVEAGSDSCGLGPLP
jgi:hypothetical protein